MPPECSKRPKLKVHPDTLRRLIAADREVLEAAVLRLANLRAKIATREAELAELEKPVDNYRLGTVVRFTSLGIAHVALKSQSDRWHTATYTSPATWDMVLALADESTLYVADFNYEAIN